MPSFKPYSNTRIPPPQTGEFGGDPYYNGGGAPAQPPTTGPANGQSRKPGRALSQSSESAENSNDELAWTTPQRGTSDSESGRYQATIRRDPNLQLIDDQDRFADGAIQVINYEEPAGDYSPGSTRSRRQSNSGGMPVNDATQLATPSSSDAMVSRLRGMPHRDDVDAASYDHQSSSGSWKAR